MVVCREAMSVNLSFNKEQSDFFSIIASKQNVEGYFSGCACDGGSYPVPEASTCLRHYEDLSALLSDFARYYRETTAGWSEVVIVTNDVENCKSLFETMVKAGQISVVQTITVVGC